MTKGIMPEAIVELIPAGSNDPPITPCGVLEHIAVSMAEDLKDFFWHKSGGLESHFYVNLDGRIRQYRNIFVEADAQGDGNSFIINGTRYGFVSVEFEGYEAGVLTTEQLMAFFKIVNFVHSQHAFKLRKAPAWNRSGLGYHSMYKEWNPNSHTCPGKDRITQFFSKIIPWTTWPTVQMVNFELGKRSEDALLVKQALAQKGYTGFNYRLPGKRIWGKGASRALKKFQADMKLAVTGKPNLHTAYLLHLRSI